MSALFEDVVTLTREHRITVTFFDNKAGSKKHEETLTLWQLSERIHQAHAASKEQLPWLKLARFGTRRSKGGSLRNNDNVLCITGVEADYDLGEMSLADAKDKIAEAGICALIYPSPSYTDAAPKWRIFCPTSYEYPPERRAVLMARLNGLFGDRFDQASFTLSQAYYFGKVGNPDHDCTLIEGIPIDLADDLDAGAIRRKQERNLGQKPTPKAKPEDITDKRINGMVNKLLGNIRGAGDGEKHFSLRDNARTLGGYLHLTNWSKDEAAEQLLSSLQAADDWDKARATALWALEQGTASPLEFPERPNQAHNAGYAKSQDAEARERAEPSAKPNGQGKTDHARQRREDEISLADLESEIIEPLIWIVPDYLPEGLTVLAGKPKIGKSWFALNIALAVARGREALGKFIEQGDVLYCGLEDGKRRMQARVRHILGPAIKGWPANFSFRRSLAPLDQGGLDTLEAWCAAHTKRRLIVIDVLGKVRGMKERNEEPYQYDYRLMTGLQELATRYRIAVVIVHHVRKSDAEDVLDTISGTTGIAGAADLALVLGLTKYGHRLAGRGRDTEDIDKLAEFDPDTGIWSITGEFDEAAPDSEMGTLRRTIYELLNNSPRPLASPEIATRVGKPRNTVRKILSRMVKDSQAVTNPDNSFTTPKHQSDIYH